MYIHIKNGKNIYKSGIKNLFLISIIHSCLIASSNKELENDYNLGNIDSGFNLALNYYNNKEYYKSAKLFFELTLKDDIRSYPYMAIQLANGYGVDKSCKKASMFLFSSIKEKECLSNKIISDFYKNGTCVKANLKKSNKYNKAYLKCKEKETSND